MNREVHVRFWESAGLRCPALLTYLKGYADGREARAGIGLWITFYNDRRPHQALGDKTPMSVWRAGLAGAGDSNAVDMTLRLDGAGAPPTYPQHPPQQQLIAA